MQEVAKGGPAAVAARVLGPTVHPPHHGMVDFGRCTTACDDRFVKGAGWIGVGTDALIKCLEPVQVVTRA